MLTLIQGGGTSVRMQHRMHDLQATASRVIKYVENHELAVAHLVASNLSPIERGVVAHRMRARGISEPAVLQVLS